MSENDMPSAAPLTGWRHTVRMTALAVRLTWSEGHIVFLSIVALSLLQSVTAVGELAIGARLVSLLMDGRTAFAAYRSSLTILGVLLALSGVAASIHVELRILLTERLHSGMIRQILDTATIVDLEDLETPEFHDRLLLATNNAHEQGGMMVWGLMSLVTTAATTIAVGGLVLSIAPVLVVIAAAAYVPLVFVHNANGRALHELDLRLTEADRHRLYHQRLLVGRVEAREIRLFDLSHVLRTRHDALFDDRLRRTRQLIGRRSFRASLAAAASGLIMSIAFGAMILLTASGHLTFGDAAVGVVGLRQLAGRFQAVGSHVGALMHGAIFLGDFDHFQARSPEQSGVPLQDPPADPSSIHLENVSYRYRSAAHDALQHITLDIPRGQILAVVGHNGSGKSTLARLLLGLHRPTEGRISWDDIDLASCEPSAVRSKTAAVFQDFVRFEHTLRENITFGDAQRPPDPERVSYAASASGVSEFAAALPNGFDTRLSTAYHGGTELSSGQWQRLAIARAIYRDAPFLVLDEPSAALDPIAEAQLFDRLRTLAAGRTVVFISHRFSTVLAADSIVVLDHGRLVEHGTHTELMAVDGAYAEMYRLQASVRL